MCYSATVHQTKRVARTLYIQLSPQFAHQSIECLRLIYTTLAIYTTLKPPQHLNHLYVHVGPYTATVNVAECPHAFTHGLLIAIILHFTRVKNSHSTVPHRQLLVSTIFTTKQHPLLLTNLCTYMSSSWNVLGTLDQNRHLANALFMYLFTLKVTRLRHASVKVIQLVMWCTSVCRPI